ncbi:MAG: hypothetical protein R2795_03105 [Saprospiraceae bacterium]
MVLCDLAADNEGPDNWIAGVEPSGIFISGLQILGSRGQPTIAHLPNQWVIHLTPLEQ